MNTKVELRIDTNSLSDWIVEEQDRMRFIDIIAGRITKEGHFIITSTKHRTQHDNIRDCMTKLQEMVDIAQQEIIERKETQQPEWVNSFRLKKKRIHSEKKQNRKKSFDYD